MRVEGRLHDRHLLFVLCMMQLSIQVLASLRRGISPGPTCTRGRVRCAQAKDLDKGLDRVLELLLERVGLQHIDDSKVKDVAFFALDTIPVLAQHRHRRPSTNTALSHRSAVTLHALTSDVHDRTAACLAILCCNERLGDASAWHVVAHMHDVRVPCAGA